jgi:hypothetical protein
MPVEMPEWILELGAVEDLEYLEAGFGFYSSITNLQQAVAALNFMRSVMVRGGDATTGKEGIRVILNHALHLDTGKSGRSPWRLLYCTLEVEKGYSAVQQNIRVKVDPRSWCTSCGTFLKRVGCGCDGVNAELVQHIDQVFPDHDTWDSRRWGSRPLTKYLPKGVTMEDYQYVQSLLKAGASIHLTPDDDDGYADSDFGDTDSCLSISDWIDWTEGSR